MVMVGVKVEIGLRLVLDMNIAPSILQTARSL